MQQLPTYVCHKRVQAAKIKSICVMPGNDLVLRLEGAFDAVVTAEERRNRPEPTEGWYLVVYDNGYFSFSPAKAFEEGYTRSE